MMREMLGGLAGLGVDERTKTSGDESVAILSIHQSGVSRRA